MVELFYFKEVWRLIVTCLQNRIGLEVTLLAPFWR